MKFDDYSLDYYYADEIEGNLARLDPPTDTEQNVIQQEQPTQIPPTATKPENEPVDIQENEEVVFSLSYILDANDTLNPIPVEGDALLAQRIWLNRSTLRI